MKIVVVSGGFDPIHSGHIAYLQEAKKIGDKLIVALNSDEWLLKKKAKYFLPYNERKTIIKNLKMVDEVIDFEDDQIGSCISALQKVKMSYPEDSIIFCNGGDRNKDNIPEMSVQGIECKFGVGGDAKKNSSSWILKDFSFNAEERVWGKFYNLFIDNQTKLKELIIEPKKGMSFQRHFFRSEIWFISKGKCLINFSPDKKDDYKEFILKKDDVFHVKKKQWHQIINPFDKPCHIIEIQYGKKLSEEDIERDRHYND